MTDNGGEFSSDEMREVASILNVRLITTAAVLIVHSKMDYVSVSIQ